MRKVLAKKTQPRKEAPIPKKRGKKREIEPSAHVIERKTKKRPSKPTTTKKTAPKTTRVKKKTSKPSAKRPSSSSRKAKSVGRAVGKVLGRAIGTVERALTKVIPSTEILKKK